MPQPPPDNEAATQPKHGSLKSCVRFCGRIMAAVVDAIVVTVGAIALFAFAARFSWAADLCCQFRVQFLILLLAFTVVYWIARRGVIAWWVLMCSVANVLPLLPYVVPHATASPNIAQEATVTRVMMLNVLSGNQYHDEVVTYIQKHNPDIFIAIEADQEWTEGLKPIRSSYPYRHIIDDRYTSSIAAYSRLPFESIDVHYATRHRLPSLDLSVTVDDEPIRIVATHPYVPLTPETARDRNTQLDELEYMLSERGSRILLGDFNCVPWSPHLQDVLRTARLKPAGYGRGLRPTWYRRARAYGPLNKTWLFALKLDHVLLSDDLQVIEHRIGPELGSDHRPVMVDFIRAVPSD